MQQFGKYYIMYKVNFIKIKLIFGLIFMIGIISIPFFTNAELKIFSSDIDVQMWPEIPEPYQNVDIKLVSYATDLNKANIEWKIGSKVVLSGYGEINYSFTTPGPDTNTNIIVSITPANTMTKITKEILINPSEVEVFWEAVDGYTPPFYKGKSLVSKQGLIKVVAIPNSSTIKIGRGNISYKWMRNDNTVQEASGYNKDSYLFENNVLKPTEVISLAASSIDGSYNAKKDIEIPTYSPKMLFYKKSPTEGTLYNSVLANEAILSEDEMTLVAVPYFLAIKGDEAGFNYTWNINGDPINTPSKKTELTIRPTSRGGFANITLTIEGISKLFQIITGQLKLTL